MPITIEQAKQLTYGSEIHANDYFNSNGTCQRFRLNGKVRTWKRDLNRIEIPVKRGLYQYYTITNRELDQFHLVEDCPQLHKLTCNDSNCHICNPPTFKPNSIL